MCDRMNVAKLHNLKVNYENSDIEQGNKFS